VTVGERHHARRLARRRRRPSTGAPPLARAVGVEQDLQAARVEERDAGEVEHDLRRRVGLGGEERALEALARRQVELAAHIDASGGVIAGSPDSESHQYEVRDLPVAEPLRYSVRLPHDPDSIPAARRALDPIQEAIPTETWRNARLLVSELVTNSVRHAGGEIELVVEKDDGNLRVEVADQGPGIEGLGRPPQSEGGWGLQIVATVADRWGVEGDHGTRIWFELAV